MVIGDSQKWADFFPEHLLPRILDVVLAAWEAMEKPAPDALETHISRRLRAAIKHAKDFKNLPFYVMREDIEDDFDTAEERGRKDLAFYPTNVAKAREEVYFAFECKRLNARVGGRVRSLAAEYVSDGMMRFVTGQYARFMRHGDMIGYVLDGHRERAVALVAANIRNRCTQLGMQSPGEMRPSSLRPKVSNIRETVHTNPQAFRLHHVFLVRSPK
jgi:hypothetical protein